MTPLLAACDICPSFVVIQQLIALGADVSVRDQASQILTAHFSLFQSLQRGQNALHLAAKTTNEMKIIDLLIKNGVDVTCSDEVKLSHSRIQKFNKKIRMEACLISWQLMTKSKLFSCSITYAIVWITSVSNLCNLSRTPLNQIWPYYLIK